MPNAHRPRLALALLTGLNVLNYLDRFVGASVLPHIKDDLHLTDAQAGLSQSLFILSYALVSPFVGVLGDRRRRLPIVAGGVAVWSVATFASGLAPSLTPFLVARAVIGVGEATYSVIAPSLLADLFPPARRGRAMAVFYGAMPVGAALGYVLGGALGSTHGWRVTFFVAGAPGALLAASLLFLREPTRGALDAVPVSRNAPHRSWRESLRALRARRSFGANVAAQTLYSFAMGGLAVWMPTYFARERGVPLAHADFLFGAILVVAGFAGTLLGGQVGDKLAQRVRGAHFAVSGWALLASVPFTAAAVLAPWPAIFWPSMFVTLLLLFVNVGPLNAAMTNVLPADLRARGFAVNALLIHLLGDAISPALIGKASDLVGLALPVLGGGLMLGLGGVVLWVARHSLDRDVRAVNA